MDYILSGDPKEVQKVLQENRIRVGRGLIKFTPYQPETAEEQPKAPEFGDENGVDPIVEDTKDAPEVIGNEDTPVVEDTANAPEVEGTKDVDPVVDEKELSEVVDEKATPEVEDTKDVPEVVDEKKPKSTKRTKKSE